MSSGGTGLFENLRLVYRNYGGVRSFIKSGYVWTAVAVTVLSWPKVKDGTWGDLSISVLPTLAGFSIAAYAVFFSVLGEKARKVLSSPAAELGNRAPLLILASSVSHAVCVQISAILLSVIFQAKPFPAIRGYELEASIFNILFSSIGMFLTAYGIILILASVLSIFRILEIQSRI